MNRSKFIFRILFIGLVAFLFERCSHSGDTKKSTIQFKLEKSVSIDDEKGLIHNTPFRINCDSDQFLGFLISPNKLIGFDVDKRKLSVLVDSIDFNVDSLIDITYQPRDIKKYAYLKHSDKDIKNYDNNLFSLSPISFYNGMYYIPLAIKTKAKYVFEDSNKNADKRISDSIKAMYGNAEVLSIESLSYIVVTDKNFKQKTIFPFYSHTEDGFLKKSKGSFVFNNQYYFPLVSNEIHAASDSMNIKGMEPKYFFKVFTFSKDGIISSKSIIDKKLINSEQYTWSKHLFQKASYRVNKNELIASLGKEFLNLTANRLYSVQPVLDEKEYISNFSFSGDYIIYTTEKYEKEGKEYHEHGYLTSLTQCFLKIEDVRTNELVFTKELNVKGIYTISPSNTIYEYLENKDSLKINKFSIHF